MKFFKNKLTATIIVLSVTFLSIVIMSLKSGDSIVTSKLGNIILPIQKIVYNLSDNVKDSFNFITNLENIKKENEELKSENAKLQNALVEYNRFKGENEELRKILGFKEVNENYDYLGCNIVGYSGGNIAEGYIVDKGLEDGIKADMVVINQDGLVGKVTKAEAKFSIVETILNQNIAVSALSEGTAENTGILRGIREETNENLVKLYNLSMDSDIKEGDVILTSGLGLVYPKEIRIGKVLSVEQDNVMVMKNAIIEPYVDFKNLEELFIIVPKNETEEIKYN